MIPTVELLRLASIAAKNAVKRYPWAQLADLEQEAVLAMLESAERHDPARGKLEPFLMYRAWDRLSAWAWEFGGPVRQRCDRNLGWAFSEDAVEDLAHRADPELLLQRAQLAHACTEALSRCSQAAQLMLIGAARAGELAEDMGEEPSAVKRQLAEARREMRAALEEHR